MEGLSAETEAVDVLRGEFFPMFNRARTVVSHMRVARTFQSGILKAPPFTARETASSPSLEVLYVLSGVHLHSESAELVGRHSRLAAWPRIAKDNDRPGCVQRAAVFVPGRSLKSNKPLSVWQIRSYLRSLNDS